jgi:tRNA(Ile)-lysidine synthase
VVCEQVRDAARDSALFARDRPVIAMISGGRDSTCLLDVAVALLGAAVVSALHVNYGLRAEADDDERHCAVLCAQLGVELDVVRAGGDDTSPREDTGQAPSPPQTGNLHAWARDLRYTAARERAVARDALVATGHTASDQVETILYRLAASPGRRALLGMVAGEGRLIRPLLTVTREQTAAYCRERGLSWREDYSNDDDRYARARVRNGVVPALRAVHPAAESNVLRTAALLREEAQLLDELVARELDGRREIALTRLAALPDALARLVVVRLAEDAADTYVPQAGDRVQDLLALGRRGGRAELHVGGLASAVVHDGVLEMIKLAPRVDRAHGRPRRDD